MRLQKFLLKDGGLSMMSLTRLKHHGGAVYVNHRQRNSAYILHDGDVVRAVMAPEIPADSVVAMPGPLDVIYEDRDLLVVNKPAGVASIPAVNKQTASMANYVKFYLQHSHAESTAIHVVTRLDRDTSGLMLFAKHSFAHTLLDRQLHTQSLDKQYLALSGGAVPLMAHGWFIMRLGLSDEFYMRRAVRPDGKISVTEYRTLAQQGDYALTRVYLHTGRTHQIRVHFAAVNRPLVGDSLYGGTMLMDRQALHCADLFLKHPFTGEQLHLHAPLPPDMAGVCKQLNLQC
ncbi:RluA family pseudouridine synthase [Lacticaseibacillus pabuli]|uniref:Pseudouridine synthase n=1 Tax=Lacticaseibacillus pabuli TaxID=3025672 RepID=A0ABY7WXZ4_9LACO|nr:RluA family pseudouridine synthase [Lacticaseibacillus sp. KACC 23028]WDF83842.1 RluA family pseudouridine synthase [Lacticaseibacillus sp. KACC 23028]